MIICSILLINIAALMLIVMSQTNNCPSSEGLYYATNPDCLIYYKCQNNIQHTGACFPWQRFDIHIMKCKQLNEVDCNPEYAGVWKTVYEIPVGVPQLEESVLGLIPGAGEITGIEGTPVLGVMPGGMPDIEWLSFIGGTTGLYSIPGLDRAQGVGGIPGIGVEHGIGIIPEIEGAQGIEGIPGLGEEQALGGLSGLRGAQGIEWIPGLEGAQGIGGISGLGWAQGIGGVLGLGGAQGIGGVPGLGRAQGVGLPGLGGAQGVGLPGLGGAQGVGGIPGLGGAQGIGGISGLSGAQGIGGISGLGGAQGIGGVPGLGGAQGIGGVPVLGGSQGLGGVPGIGGIPGLGGTQGVGGIPGLGGTQGVGGIPGLGGAQGIGGIPGLAGAQGVGGLPGLGGAQGVGGLPGLGEAQGLGGVPGIGGIPGIGGAQGVGEIPELGGAQSIGGIPGLGGPQSLGGWQGVGGIPGLGGIQGFPGLGGTQGVGGIQGGGGLPGIGGIPGIGQIPGIGGFLMVDGMDTKEEVNTDSGLKIKKHPLEKGLLTPNENNERKSSLLKKDVLVDNGEIKEGSIEVKSANFVDDKKEASNMMYGTRGGISIRENNDKMTDQCLIVGEKHEKMVDKILFILKMRSNVKHMMEPKDEVDNDKDLNTTKLNDKLITTQIKMLSNNTLNDYEEDYVGIAERETHKVSREYCLEEINKHYENNRVNIETIALEPDQKQQVSSKGYWYWCGSGRFVFVFNEQDGRNICLNLEDPESIDRESVTNQNDGHTYIGSSMIHR